MKRNEVVFVIVVAVLMTLLGILVLGIDIDDFIPGPQTTYRGMTNITVEVLDSSGDPVVGEFVSLENGTTSWQDTTNSEGIAYFGSNYNLIAPRDYIVHISTNLVEKGIVSADEPNEFFSCVYP